LNLTPGTNFTFDLSNNYIYYNYLINEEDGATLHLVYNVNKNTFELFKHHILEYLVKHSKIKQLDFKTVQALYGDPTEPPSSVPPRRNDNL
jgi:hypothetical protein